jgi:protein-tyrosine-phosphatase
MMASFFPDQEKYTKTWGPILESAGVTLVLGTFITLAAHRAWPEGLNEILLVFLSTEFLWDPALFLALLAVSFIPSAIWLVLHPLVDARRIDRNPTLQKNITRKYSLLFKQALAFHAIAFTASAAAGIYLLHGGEPQWRMPLALGVYGCIHAILHLLCNRFGSRFSRQSHLNLQAHLFTLLQTDRPRFEDSIRILGALWAFHHGLANRLEPILHGRERVNPIELLPDLDFLIHEFPPREGLESILKVAAPDQAAQFQPVVDQLLTLLASKTPLSVRVTPDNDPTHLLSRAPKNRPLQILCACVHNYNRSPAMAATLKWLLHQKGLAHKVTVSSGGIAPIPRPNLQMLSALRSRGISAEPQHPRPIPDMALSQAHLILAADVATALNLGWRLYELDPDPAASHKIVLFTALDKARFRGQDRLPDPATDSISLKESVIQIQETLEHALLPALAAATVPGPLIALAGRLLRGLFPGDVPTYQVEKRMRLLLAIARNDPRYLIHLDRKNFDSHQLPADDVRFLWDDYRVFNETFLAQLCARFPERELIRSRSPHAKDYGNSMVALSSLLSPVIHRIEQAAKAPPPTS